MLVQRLKSDIKKLCNIHIQGDLPNIFIFSTARSGSTWVMEMLATQRGMKFIDEPPLMTKHMEGVGALPPSWDFLLPNSDRKALLYAYFQDLIENKVVIESRAPFSLFHR